jgi:hypothetical protein
MRRWTSFLFLTSLLSFFCLQFQAGCELPVSSPPYSYIDRFNRLIVDGKPFFPIGLYWVKIEDMKKVAEYGFNYVHTHVDEVQPPNPDPGDGRLPFRAFCDAARARGLKTVFWFERKDLERLENGTYEWSGLEAVLSATKDHPAIIANKIVDEPENFFYRDINNVYHMFPFGEPEFLSPLEELMAGSDPGRPTMLSNSYPGVITKYAGIAGIQDLDIYPVFAEPNPTRLYDVAVRTDAARAAVADSRPVWVTLQAYGNIEGEGRKGRFPSRVEIRNMTYLALVHGAMGLTYFRWVPHPSETWVQNQELHDAIIELAGELRDLTPALLSTETVRLPPLCDDPDLESMIKYHEGRSYLFAVYNGATPRRIRINLRGAGTSVPVLFENRPAVAADENGFSDDFAAYAVHVYRTDGVVRIGN